MNYAELTRNWPAKAKLELQQSVNEVLRAVPAVFQELNEVALQLAERAAALDVPAETDTQSLEAVLTYVLLADTICSNEIVLLRLQGKVVPTQQLARRQLLLQLAEGLAKACAKKDNGSRKTAAPASSTQSKINVRAKDFASDCSDAEESAAEDASHEASARAPRTNNKVKQRTAKDYDLLQSDRVQSLIASELDLPEVEHALDSSAYAKHQKQLKKLQEKEELEEENYGRTAMRSRDDAKQYKRLKQRAAESKIGMTASQLGDFVVSSSKKLRRDDELDFDFDSSEPRSRNNAKHKKSRKSR